MTAESWNRQNVEDSYYFQRHFCDLWGRLFPKKPYIFEWETVYRFIGLMYSAPDRFYHNLEHIIFGLKELGKWENFFKEELKQSMDPLLMAWWFHDIVYEPGSKTNESDSAMLASHILRACDLDTTKISKIMHLINCTNYSETYRIKSIEASFIRSIDLLSLAADPEIFDANTEKIGKEFLTVISPEQWARGRAQFMYDMYSQRRIYDEDYYHNKYEERAKDNLKRALLKGQTNTTHYN
jgi:predicted metal-dependent HD superfamily phosphohydrolase